MSNTLRLNIALFSASMIMVGSAIILHAQSAAMPATQPAASAIGTWKWTAQGPGGDQETVLVLKQDGDKVTGTITGFGGDNMAIEDAAIKDGIVTFKTIADFNGMKLETDYTATVHADSLNGKSATIFAREFEGKRSQ